MHALDHIAMFQLGMEQTCTARVKVLLDSETYIYPGQWNTDATGKVSGICYLGRVIDLYGMMFVAEAQVGGEGKQDLHELGHHQRAPFVLLLDRGLYRLQTQGTLQVIPSGPYRNRAADFNGCAGGYWGMSIIV